MSVVKCPTCQREAEWSANNAWRPFCCERCKLIDLGDWATEKHAIPVMHTENDTDTPQEFSSSS